MNTEKDFLKFTEKKEFKDYYFQYFFDFNNLYFYISPDKIFYTESILFNGKTEKELIEEINKNLYGEKK